MEKENKVTFQVSGRVALFSDPLTRVGGEKCSYPIPTYEALKGILESCYWKPTFCWIIDRVRVMNPIRTQSTGVRPIIYNGGNTLSYYTYLTDVLYQVQAHFIWNEYRPELKADRNENKHFAIANRMIEKGGRRDIFLGTRECQGYIEPCVFGEGKGAYDELDEMSFGTMVHGFSYPDETGKGQLELRLWQPKMQFGVITFPPPWECTQRCKVRNYQVKSFIPQENFSYAEELIHEEGLM